MKDNHHRRGGVPPTAPRYADGRAQAAYEAIMRCEGDLIVVHFTKRTDGSRRRMLCLYNARATDRASFGFNPVEKLLLAVWDCEKGAPRMVSLDGVERVVCRGRVVYAEEQSRAENPTQKMESIAALFDTFTDAEQARRRAA